MPSKKVVSNSSVASDAYTGPITRSRSKGITQEQDQGSNVAQSILKQLMESLKAGIVLKENLLYDNSDSASSKSKKEAHPDVVEERDHEITTLKEQMRTRETAESSKTLVVKATDKGKNNATWVPTSKIPAIRWKGQPKAAYPQFIETCENAGSRGDQLVRKFVRSLKGNAFEWYTNLEPEVIDSWEKLEKEFLNRFYSTRHRLTELSAVEMCTQGMHWGLIYILQGIKPHTFEELATRAHDMELSIASRGTKDFPIPEVRKDKKEMKSAEKVVKSTVKESMVEKIYPFPDSDIADMLEQLLEKQLIQLSECKRPEQAGKVDDPNYCKYHRVISHPVEKCFVLKELILRLAREKKVELNLEEVAQTNHAAVTIMSETFLPRLIFEQRESLVQFGTFEPVVVQFHQEVAPEDSREKERSIEEDDEGWIVVTRRKKRKSTSIQKESRFYRNYRRGNKAEKNKKKKKTQKLKFDENLGVVACHAINATEEESIPLRSLEEEEVSKDLSRFNVDDLLSLPQKTKIILINALLNSAASSSSVPTTTYESTPYCMFIDFSNMDLLLGSKLHNRPLYVSGYVREQRVDRILIDNGSAINIMPKSTMRQLGILIDELSNSKLVIQGFNQGSKRVIGMIRLELIIGDLKASALFHVIDLRTTYKLLLDRPWIHGNGVVTSALHQCFKFYQDGIKKVEADPNPFSEAESHFADAKFYLKNDNSPEAVSVEVPLGKASTSTRKSMILMDEKTSNPPILRYVPLSRCKKGESPFVKSPQGLKVGDIEVLKESFTTPFTKITKQEIKIDLTEASLPQSWTKDGFDPKAYKLMAKVGYDFTTHIEFKSLKIHEQPKLSSTQKKLLREGHAIPMSRKGLGYKSPEPIRITRKGKEKVVDNNHITVKEVDSMKEKEGDGQRTSAFDRISPHVARTPVFERLSMTEVERKDHQSTSNLDRRSAFQRLTMTSKKEKGICQAWMTTRPSAFERLSMAKKKNVQTPRPPIFNRLRDEGSHVQTGSSIDTKKKESTSRASVWCRIKHTDVESCHGKEFPWEVKRHDVILINPEKEDSKQREGEISCHHITILEELEIEIPEEDAEDVPQSLEDGGQSTVDELKKVNLGTIEEPHPTFISVSLSSEEEGKHMSLLIEYKDIFAWSYKEMPGLDPKVAVHHLAIKQGYRPIKQAQRRFRPELIPQIEVKVNKLIEVVFIREVKYPTWIANIVHVRKKNGQLRICVDFHDLNNACPKDDFPLHITEIMVDATTGHEALSFIDGSSGYNQIRMTL
ncbi:retrotransposon gag protein [Cucumis melo var. makuwa]|uniref:Retrotransposon gag protein n=1 Tax=Cucumis melo var. makuwa TaxID=1194695 RepID=A0A5A7TJZ7_CUCMM|nr:retrotransposon gag protein [Cucumis melo var. makuwa]TYK18009.1 retrotransposon gag protein [Cucumis melo var. makuwa]